MEHTLGGLIFRDYICALQGKAREGGRWEPKAKSKTGKGKGRTKGEEDSKDSEEESSKGSGKTSGNTAEKEDSEEDDEDDEDQNTGDGVLDMDLSWTAKSLCASIYNEEGRGNLLVLRRKPSSVEVLKNWAQAVGDVVVESGVGTDSIGGASPNNGKIVFDLLCNGTDCPPVQTFPDGGEGDLCLDPISCPRYCRNQSETDAVAVESKRLRALGDAHDPYGGKRTALIGPHYKGDSSHPWQLIPQGPNTDSGVLPCEASYFLNLAEQKKCQVLIESGVRNGQSTAYWCHWIKNGEDRRVFSVDRDSLDHLETNSFCPNHQFLPGRDGMAAIPELVRGLAKKGSEEDPARICLFIDGPKGQVAVRWIEQLVSEAVEGKLGPVSLPLIGFHDMHAEVRTRGYHRGETDHDNPKAQGQVKAAPLENLARTRLKNVVRPDSRLWGHYRVLFSEESTENNGVGVLVAV